MSGLTQSIAGNIVALRDQRGSFANRSELLNVTRFGEKTFEQSAGFLRVMGGDNPLDASAVHPESYRVVATIAERQQRDIGSMIGDASFLRALDPAAYTDDQVGLPTVIDILSELAKPGRDPRPEFRMAVFQEGVEKISDLVPDMILEGTVTNVTAFGAFVDIGVHQDGLVHISALAERFVKDPREVVKAGDIVRVKVMEIDPQRKRIGLSMRLSDKAGEQAAQRGPTPGKRGGDQKPRRESSKPGKPAAGGAFAAAFAEARKTR